MRADGFYFASVRKRADGDLFVVAKRHVTWELWAVADRMARRRDCPRRLYWHWLQLNRCHPATPVAASLIWLSRQFEALPKRRLQSLFDDTYGVSDADSVPYVHDEIRSALKLAQAAASGRLSVFTGVPQEWRNPKRVPKELRPLLALAAEHRGRSGDPWLLSQLTAKQRSGVANALSARKRSSLDRWLTSLSARERRQNEAKDLQELLLLYKEVVASRNGVSAPARVTQGTRTGGRESEGRGRRTRG